MIIDLAASIAKSGDRISPKFIAMTLGRPIQTVHNWIKTQVIPRASNERLISLFTENGVEPVFMKFESN